MNKHLLLSEAGEQPGTKHFSGNARKDHPGIYIPPPLIYVAFFFLSVLMQKILPLHFIGGTTLAKVLGLIFISLYICLFLPALQNFIASKNTLVTIKPASALQTTGIYAITRNPMYLSLIMLYTGVAMFKGNWYTLLLLPLLIGIVQLSVIRKEEKYLQRAFGEDYVRYRSKVRRWI